MTTKVPPLASSKLIKMTAQNTRIRIHNKKIRLLRESGKLRPLGMTTKRYNKIIKQTMEKDIEESRKKEPNMGWISSNGSLLPNKYLFWPYPFDKITEKDL